MEECKDCDQSVGYTCVGCEFSRLEHRLKSKDQRISQLESALRDMREASYEMFIALNDRQNMDEAQEDYIDCLSKHKEILDTINKRGEE